MTETEPKKMGGDSSNIYKPNLTQDQIKTLVLENYGLVVLSMKEFPSYDDLNYYLVATPSSSSSSSSTSSATTTTEQKEYVIKINNQDEDRSALDLQNSAMIHLRQKGFPSPPVLKNLRGELIFEIDTQSLQVVTNSTEVAAAGDDNSVINSKPAYPVRLLGFVPGTLLCDIKTTPEHYFNIGKFLGQVDIAFESLSHPAATRNFMWDMKNASAFRKHIPLVQDENKRAIAHSILDLFDSVVVPLMAQANANPEEAKKPDFPGLRVAIIHGDCNDHNILVSQSPPVVTGIIDFGDVVQSHLVCDIAVSTAYCVLDQSDPMTVAGSTLKGFLAVKPLNKTELSVFTIILCARLAMSVLMSAKKQTLYPNDAYLRVTERPAWAFLTEYWPKGLEVISKSIFTVAGVEIEN